jgi:pseudouridine-5'-phosphate glycosidase
VGGTTVAGTMYVARSVGVGLFVTGGIGGVHRGAESSEWERTEDGKRLAWLHHSG